MSNAAKGAYRRGYRALFVAVPALVLTMTYGFSYALLEPSGGSASRRMWAPIQMVHDAFGAGGLLGAAIVMAIVTAACLGIYLRAVARLRQSEGDDAADQLRLEQVRESTERAVPLAGMPAHLDSVAAHRAYKRRLLVAFVGLLAVVAFIFLAASLGL